LGHSTHSVRWQCSIGAALPLLARPLQWPPRQPPPLWSPKQPTTRSFAPGARSVCVRVSTFWVTPTRGHHCRRKSGVRSRLRSLPSRWELAKCSLGRGRHSEDSWS
jgi:hypothetical protein